MNRFCSADTKYLRLWTLRNGAAAYRILFGHTKWIRAATWLADGRPVSAAEDGAIIIWDVVAERPAHRLTGHAGGVLSLTYSGLTGMLASGSIDQTVCVWDVSAYSRTQVLQGHTTAVTGVSLAANGRLLASVASDGTLRIARVDSDGRWDFASVVEGAGPHRFSPVTVFHPKRPLLARTGGETGSVQILDIDEPALHVASDVAAATRYTTAKVVLVGKSGSGKTCLGRALVGLPFEPQPSSNEMTVWRFATEEARLSEDVRVTRETMLWDLPGQDDYQIVHQLFLDQTDLGLVVFDPSDIDDPFRGAEYWEKALRRVAQPGSERLLVAGRLDAARATVDLEQISTFCTKHGFAHYFPTSAAMNVGIAALREAIGQTIPWDRLPVTTSPQLWHTMRQFLLERRQANPLITRRQDLGQEFREENPGATFTDAEFDTVIRHAQVQGFVWRLSFGDLMLLQPERLNSYASAIVLAARAQQGLGALDERAIIEARIDFGALKRLDDPEAERSLLYAVVELLLQRELALRQDGRIVFPSKLSRRRSDTSDARSPEATYVFSGPGEEIYATLIVRLSYSGAFELKEAWRNEADFLDISGRACHLAATELGEGRSQISVAFEREASIETRLLLQRFLDEHVRERALSGSVVRHRTYFCPNPACGEEFVDRRAIQRRLEGGQDMVRCAYCDGMIPLIDRIEQRFASEELRTKLQRLDAVIERKRDLQVAATGPFDVFLAHKTEDTTSVEAIGMRLREAGLNPWLDKWHLPPGRSTRQEIEKILPAVRAVAVFVGHHGIGVFQDLEVDMAVEEMLARRCPVIPVLLPGVDKPQLPPSLRTMGWVKLDASDAISTLIFGITGRWPPSHA